MKRGVQRAGAGDLGDDSTGSPKIKKPGKAKSKAKAKAKGKAKASPKSKAQAKAKSRVSKHVGDDEADGASSPEEEAAEPPKRARGRGGRGPAKKPAGRGRGRGRVLVSEGAMEISDGEGSGEASEVECDPEPTPVLKRPAGKVPKTAAKSFSKKRKEIPDAEVEVSKPKRTTFAGRRCPEGEIPKARFLAMMDVYATRISAKLQSPSQFEASLIGGCIFE